jgi:hypothetical protein
MVGDPMRPLDDPDLDRLRSPWLMAMLLALAAVAVGYGVHMRDGEYSFQEGWNRVLAIHWVGVGIVLTAAGVILSRVREPRWGGHAVIVLLALCLAFQFVQLLISPPSGWHDWSNDLRLPGARSIRLYYAGVAAAGVLSAGLLFRDPVIRRVCLAAVLLTHLLLGCWMVRATPNPKIDVFVFQQQAPAALLHGKNPYAMTFEDIYASDKPGERKVYGAGMAKDGKTGFGFPYPPVSLLMSTAGYAAAGDYRYAHAVYMTLAATLLAFARPSRLAALAAVLLLFTPRAFFVIGRGWSEPNVAVLLAAVVFCALRFPKVLPFALGLFLASKQYLVLAGPAVVVLAMAQADCRRAWGLIWKSALVAIVVTAPLALWDWKSFWYSTVTVQKEAPFRDDALSFLVWWKSNVGDTLLGRPLAQAAVITSFGAAALGILLGLWRASRTVAGFAAVLALTFLPFYALNKQAFANYYYFTTACLCAAAAASRLAVEPVPASPADPATT